MIIGKLFRGSFCVLWAMNAETFYPWIHFHLMLLFVVVVFVLASQCCCLFGFSLLCCSLESLIRSKDCQESATVLLKKWIERICLWATIREFDLRTTGVG